MRLSIVPATALLLLLPTMAAAQQRKRPAAELFPAVSAEAAIRLTPSPPLPTPASDAARGALASADVEPSISEASQPWPQPGAPQEGGPTTREWWYLVGAIVAGGIILALLL